MQPQVITVRPPGVVAPGTSRALRITSSKGLDLSSIDPDQVSFSPDTGISNLTISNRSEHELTLSFDLGDEAPAGNRILTVSMSDVSASAKFQVVKINISPNRIVAVAGTSRDLRVTSSEEFNLSHVVREQVRISPRDGISHIAISDATERSLTLSVSFDSVNDVATLVREVVITVNTVSASVKLEVLPT